MLSSTLVTTSMNMDQMVMVERKAAPLAGSTFPLANA